MLMASSQTQFFYSLGIYSDICSQDRFILPNAFRNMFSDLTLCDVVFSEQWQQTDTSNCGVFVCTAAEAIVRDIIMGSTTLLY